MQKIDQLTFTRFLAAIMVVFYHSAVSGAEVLPFNLFPVNHIVSSSGFSAVTYFFVLSGFIMSYAYYRPEDRFRFGAYWQARIARIYPVFIFSLILTLWYYREIFVKLLGPKLLANIFLVQAWIPKYALSFNIPAWSLSVEMFFYFLFPFMALLAIRIRPRTVIWISIIFWFISQIVHMTLLTLYMPKEQSTLLYNPLFHLDSFLLGMAGGIWFLSKAPRLRISRKVNLGLLISATLFVIALMMADSMNPGSLYFVDSGIFAPLFLVIILTISLDQTRLSILLRKPAFVLLGDASYSIYVLHIPVRWLLEEYVESHSTFLSQPYYFYYIYFLITVGVSVLAFKLIEAPSRTYLKDIFRRVFPLPPLFLWDLLVISISVVSSFILRLGPSVASRNNIYLFLTALVILLFVRTLAFGITRLYSKIDKPQIPIGTAKAVLWPVALGSMLGAALWFLLYRGGLLDSFSRSILLMEWFFSSVFVFLVHYRTLKRKQVTPSSA
jgi:peptidoglycan/LPS O-acetylase OafA/YrhL